MKPCYFFIFFEPVSYFNEYSFSYPHDWRKLKGYLLLVYELEPDNCFEFFECQFRVDDEHNQQCLPAG
jgi:hypothetical protein